MPDQLECRVVITNHPGGYKFDLGMYDPVSGRYEPLGTHRRDEKDKVVQGLKDRIEREGHKLTFSEVTGAK